MTKKILLATANKHKIEEIKYLLNGIPYEIVSVLDFENIKEVEEGKETYLENASLKALGYSKQTGILSLADDSGLEIDCLGGKPGVMSSRFLSEAKSYSEKNSMLLEMIKDVPQEKRGARFVCTAVLAYNGKVIKSFIGELKGSIAFEKAGNEGFGYDPVFYVPEYKTTLASVPAEIKNQISHRANAMKQVKEFLTNHLFLI